MSLQPLSAIRLIALSAAMLVSAAVCLAQDTGKSYQDVLEQSRELFVRGNYNAAETLLFKDNADKRNTGAWSLEAGTKLMHLAASFLNRHDPKNAKLAAADALAYLNEAETRLVGEGKPETAARSQETAGIVYEQILHDDADALDAYRKALNHSPNAAAAKNANARLGGPAKGGS
jgi:hypothetical protein